MSITIREALQLPDMVQTRLVAGESGLDNQIRWVTIVEILDDTTRLQAGEFLITTGFGLEEDREKLEQFIPRLARRGLSGVAIHTGFYLREIPQALIETANRHGLPLIEIPVELNFSHVTKAILQPIVNRQFETLAYSQAIHEQMIRISLSGGGLAAIAGELARLTKGNVTIRDAFGHQFAATPSKSESVEPAEEVSLPIQTARETYGTVTLSKPCREWQELDQIALQHASTLCALEFVKERAVIEAEWRMQGDFAEEIINGRFSRSRDTETRSRMLGYPLAGCHQVAALQVGAADQLAEAAEQHHKLIRFVKRLAENHGVPCLLRERSAHLLMILPSGKASDRLLAQLPAQWAKSAPDSPLAAAVSSPRSELAELAEAAQEAVYALQVYPLIKPQAPVLRYADMEGYQFLFPFHQQQEALRKLWSPLLDELLAYDKQYGHRLLDTLQVYLEANLNGLQAAQTLYIHRHTLKYRLQQIEAKTGKSLANAAQRWQLQLALMAYRLQVILFKS
ncbi:PucR family transcriptional regulator [Brevibacillus sp. B_LB10_24]|uniref:PucR family transcriptional regulator n=1 Tax=Brevibacillus sp. B_LB10_24 TaxID=3380645 RepID=UPI0038BDEAD4